MRSNGRVSQLRKESEGTFFKDAQQHDPMSIAFDFYLILDRQPLLIS
jgi:hypothetical protein